MRDKKLDDFIICADMTVVSNITIKAKSLEDALEQSKSLGVLDFIEFKDEYVDGSIKITGIFE